MPTSLSSGMPSYTKAMTPSPVARTGEAPGAKGLSAFLLPADTPGLRVLRRSQGLQKLQELQQVAPRTAQVALRERGRWRQQ